MKKCGMLVLAIVGGLCGLTMQQSLYGISSLAKNDPYPLFTTNYPYNFLLDKTKNYLKGIDCEYEPRRVGISFTGIYQKANRGCNYDREKTFLGELEGRWNILGMLYGPVPPQNAIPTTLAGTRLGEAKVFFFGTPSGVMPTCLAGNVNVPDAEVKADCILNDCQKEFGFVSAPIKYRKHAVRFEAVFQPFSEDFGLLLQGGYADIKQTLTGFINDGADLASRPPFTPTITGPLNDLLMSCSSLNRIFREQNINVCTGIENVCDFREGSFEDLRFSAWVRHIFPVNQGDQCEWPEFLFIPFFNFEGSVFLGKVMPTNRVLAAPFGNNGHSSIAFTTGFHIDFNETVEIGFYGGITHFSKRRVNKYHLPNHETQSGVFPFATDVDIRPGNNHSFNISLHAYRFIDKLSAYVDFTFVNHDADHITLIDSSLEDVFRVCQRACLTKFTSQFLTTAGNYEISPNISLGFAVQWPLQQRNAYRSTTVLGTLNMAF